MLSVTAEERVGKKRRQQCFSSALHFWECRSGKARRQICSTVSSLSCSVSSPLQTLDANTIPYVVQKGDTLTSIAMKTKTSVQRLADANRIEDVDFLLSGQLLQIPTNSDGLEVPGRPAVGQDEFPIARSYDSRSSFPKGVSHQERISKGTGVKALPKSEGSRLSASVQSVLPCNFPKQAFPILLIAPLLGFCIRCIVDALYIHMDHEEANDQVERDAWEKVHSPKAKRWQKILEEDRDCLEETSVNPEGSTQTTAWAGGEVWTRDDNMRESSQEIVKSETDEERGLRHKQDYEDIQKSYAELESVYVKFLVDSGMSKSGYWRGSGLPTTARLDKGEP